METFVELYLKGKYVGCVMEVNKIFEYNYKG
jgi:hypothetical protein